MPTRRIYLLAALALALAMGVVTAGRLVAPPQLGGSTSFAVIAGSSMDPRLRAGDMALVRRRSTYHVGDVVAYRNQALHRVVLHRIVGRDGDRFVFKGDNNETVDSLPVAQDQVLGELWLRVPRAGQALQWVRRPAHASILVGILAALSLTGSLGAATRRRRRRPAPVERTPEPTPLRLAVATAPVSTRVAPHSVQLVQAAPALLGVCAAAAAGFIALGAAAYTRPATTDAPAHDLYTQVGTFSYSAHAPVGAVYQSRKIPAGGPVYVKVVDRVDLSFTYSLRSRYASAVAGTARLAAELTDGHGWKRELLLQPRVRFEGGGYTLRGVVAPARLAAAINAFETQTGAHSDSYKLLLHPRVDVRGVVDGTPFSDSFEPELSLLVDQVRVQLDGPAETADGAAPSLVQTKPAGVLRSAPGRIGALGVSLEVTTARRLAPLGAALALLALLLVGVLTWVLRRNEPVRIAARYGSLLVQTSSPQPLAAGDAVAVDSFATIVRLARKYDRLIVHEQINGEHVYSLAEDGVRYRYVAGRRPPVGAQAPALPARRAA